MAPHRLVFLILVFPFVIGDKESDSNLLVQTNSGPVRGMLVTGHTNKKARAFFGIPYAESPTGKLRFKPPVPVSSWTDTFDATRTPLPCFQTYSKEMLEVHRNLEHEVRRPWSEDCLTLNVWTPEVVPDDAPIIIFIHDGGFLTGTGAYPNYELSTYATEVEVVAVSINYRLGAFGFLSLGTQDVTGNLGLMDQHLAFRWVNDNNGVFGGKPGIFLCGFGAGAASIGHHIILNQSAGLFRAVIMFGASSICPWTWQTKENAVKLGRSLARNLGCQNESIGAEIDCLQKVHPEDIVDASCVEPELFKPNIDGTFIKEPPADAMKAGRFNKVTVLAMNTGAESALFFHSMNKDLLSEEEGLTAEGFDEAVRRVGLAQTETNLNLIRNWYLNQNCHKSATVIRDQAVQVYSDAFIICCMSEFLDYATEGGALVYRILFRVPDPRFPAWMASHGQANLPVLLADTLKAEKNYEFQAKQDTLNALMLSRIYLRKKAKELQELVPVYTLEDQSYFDWGKVQQSLKHHRQHECELWNNIWPKIKSRSHVCH